MEPVGGHGLCMGKELATEIVIKREWSSSIGFGFEVSVYHNIAFLSWPPLANNFPYIPRFETDIGSFGHLCCSTLGKEKMSKSF